MADEAEPTYQPETPLASIEQPNGVKATFVNPRDAAEAAKLKHQLDCAKRGMRTQSVDCGGPIQ